MEQLPRINVKKLVEDIKALEDKQIHGKRVLHPIWSRYYQEVGEWYNKNYWKEEWNQAPRPIFPKDVERFDDQSDRLTKLYSLRAAIHGKLHMTRKRLDHLYQPWLKKENILDSNKFTVNPSTFVVRWTEEDQERLIQDIIEEYKIEEPVKIRKGVVARVINYITT